MQVPTLFSKHLMTSQKKKTFVSNHFFGLSISRLGENFLYLSPHLLYHSFYPSHLIHKTFLCLTSHDLLPHPLLTRFLILPTTTAPNISRFHSNSFIRFPPSLTFFLIRLHLSFIAVPLHLLLPAPWFR